MKFTVTSLHPFGDMPDLEARFAKEYNSIEPDDPQTPGEVQAIVTNSNLGLPDWVWEAPKLKIIGNFGVGYDGLDTRTAAEKGIWITNTPTVLNDAVAELAMCLMTMVVRSVKASEEYLRSGGWKAGQLLKLSDTLHERNLGLVGMGAIGKEIAARAAAHKMKIRYHSRSTKDVPYEYVGDLIELAEKSDLLCCIVPGGAQTEKMINEQVLDALGKDGYLVNVARGSVVDEVALIKSLNQGKIAGAALDVFENEPDVSAELLALPNVIALPHVGSATMAARLAMGNLVCDNINAVLSGHEPLTPVNQVRL